MLEQMKDIFAGADKSPAVFYTVQGDSGRELVLKLPDMTIPNDAETKLTLVLPSGTVTTASGTVDGQTVTVPLSSQNLAEYGKLVGQLQFKSDDLRVTSYAFFVENEEALT